MWIKPDQHENVHYFSSDHWSIPYLMVSYRLLVRSWTYFFVRWLMAIIIVISVEQKNWLVLLIGRKSELLWKLLELACEKLVARVSVWLWRHLVGRVFWVDGYWQKWYIYIYNLHTDLFFVSVLFRSHWYTIIIFI